MADRLNKNMKLIELLDTASIDEFGALIEILHTKYGIRYNKLVEITGVSVATFKVDTDETPKHRVKQNIRINNSIEKLRNYFKKEMGI